MKDVTLNIAIGASASSAVWNNKQIKWSELVEKLSSPIVTAETIEEYAKMTKQDKLRAKDVGGFVGGKLAGKKRSMSSVQSRQLIALDADYAYDGLWEDFMVLYDCAACMHSTHSHTPKNPRYRIFIPLDRPVTAEEYEAIGRRIAADLGMELFDATTFEANRLMFWPSVSSNVDFVFEKSNSEILSADKVLATYDDWTDITEWPTHSGVNIKEAAEKQQDPALKDNIVGLFCRTYGIHAAIESFLSDIYEPTVDENRFTYKAGSTAAGAVVYDDTFIYSHHGTDPAGGRLCNAFDLVRIHKFGKQDTERDAAKDEQKRTSYRAMEQFVSELPEIRQKLAAESLEQARRDFGQPQDKNAPEGEFEAIDPKGLEWAKRLTMSAGHYEATSANIQTILANDPNLKNAFGYNTFDNRRYIMRSLIWRKVDTETGYDCLRDVDYAGVRSYLELVYGISSPAKVDDALSLEFEKNKFNPVVDYLNSLQWDGVCRLDTLLIDYFGADDTKYTRDVTRKTLCAAVSRVFHEGLKFDNMLILVGKQGTYKSTFIKKLARSWFSDTFMGFQGKEAYEQLQGAWLIEIAELAAFKKAEVESIKQFLSKCEDSFRPAYGRVVETYKRKCVFIGTDNNADFLKDTTGNRRFWPVDVHEDLRTKLVTEDLDDYEVDQIWAEAVVAAKTERLFLDDTARMEATERQRAHTELDDRAGLVEQYLDRKLPNNWYSMSIPEHLMYLSSDDVPKDGFIRSRTCPLEIYCECFGGDVKNFNSRDKKAIEGILELSGHWLRVGDAKANFGETYGRQRYYSRTERLEDLL